MAMLKLAEKAAGGEQSNAPASVTRHHDEVKGNAKC
jgi:hypothetical protein